MAAVKPRRVEYVEQTRDALLQAAEHLFVSQGYGATSIDAVGAAARFTKGAVYRHFPDKEALFTAVLERVAGDAVTGLEQPGCTSADPWEAGMRTLAGYLDVCMQERYRRIALEEAPKVLGWSRWRELDQRFTGQVLARQLDHLVEAGEIAPQPVEPLARLCCALIGEAALLVAGADDPAAMRASALTTLERMFGGLRLPAGPSRP